MFFVLLEDWLEKYSLEEEENERKKIYNEIEKLKKEAKRGKILKKEDLKKIRRMFVTKFLFITKRSLESFI